MRLSKSQRLARTGWRDGRAHSPRWQFAAAEFVAATVNAVADTSRRFARVGPLLGRAVMLAAAGVITVPVLAGLGVAAVPAAATSGSPGGLRAACGPARPGFARCLALFRPQYAVDRALAAGQTASPTGWGARQIEAAYRLPVGRVSHQVVAVSIAFDAPNLARDLAVYRSHFGLPACTRASGCLRIVNQHGKPGPLPQSGVASGWRPCNGRSTATALPSPLA